MGLIVRVCKACGIDANEKSNGASRSGSEPSSLAPLVFSPYRLLPISAWGRGCHVIILLADTACSKYTESNLNQYYLSFLFGQNRWDRWAMLLWPVEWSTVSTSIAPIPLPSTLLTTPRQKNSGTPTYSSQTSTATTPWWTTTPEKEYCTLGTTGVKSLTLLPLNKSSIEDWTGRH